MPCTGSRKSGDSTMLSCLSPRRPCCGPNAAVMSSPRIAAQRIERMLELGGHRGRMRQQRHAPPLEFALQLHVAQQAIDSELDHACSFTGASEATKLSAWWKSGFSAGCLSAKYDSTRARSSITALNPRRSAASEWRAASHRKSSVADSWKVSALVSHTISGRDVLRQRLHVGAVTRELYAAQAPDGDRLYSQYSPVGACKNASKQVWRHRPSVRFRGSRQRPENRLGITAQPVQQPQLMTGHQELDGQPLDGAGRRGRMWRQDGAHGRPSIPRRPPRAGSACVVEGVEEAAQVGALAGS